MKKLVSVLLLVVFCLSLSSCINEEPVQVQSISYSEGNLTSSFSFQYSVENITKEEYDNAAEKMGEKFYTSGIIEVDGTAKNQGNYHFNDGHTPEQLQDRVGKTYYCHNLNLGYVKLTYTSLTISYINVRFLSDGALEVSYAVSADNEMQMFRIKSENYKIVYFLEAE